MTCGLGDPTCGWLGTLDRGHSQRNKPLCDEHRFQRHVDLLDGMVSRATHVYYAERAGQIKIGSTSDPDRRCRQLKAQLLAIEPGRAHDEGQRHAQFRHARVPGTTEWFSADDPALTAHIASLAGVARPSTANSPGGEGRTGTAGSTTTSPGTAESSCVASSTVAAPAAPVVPLRR